MNAIPPRYADALARLAASGDHWHAPLIRAAGQGLMQVAFVPRGERVPCSWLADARPTVIVLAGDDETGPAPPETWPQHKRLLRWAARVLLHAAAGEAWHYELAVQAALATRRVLLVECDSASLPAWTEAARRWAPRSPALGIAPTWGPHPVAAVRH